MHRCDALWGYDLLTKFCDCGEMANYTRPRTSGATIFFTVNLANRTSDLLVQEVDKLRDAFMRTLADRKFNIDAIVVMPDHLHAVITLPENDHDYATRWSVIKGRFSRQIGKGNLRDSNLRRRERGIWQRRYWEHHIRSENDYRAHIEYCWKNPVKHGYVERPVDWPYSSIHRDIRLGHAPKEWQ
jgi:putative transposase